MGSNASASVVFGIEISSEVTDQEYPWNKEENNTEDNDWWNDPEEWLSQTEGGEDFSLYAVGNAYADAEYYILGLKEKKKEQKFHKWIWEGEIVSVAELLNGMSPIDPNIKEALAAFVKKHFPGVDKEAEWLIEVSYG
jgi:hypothetical protein